MAEELIDIYDEKMTCSAQPHANRLTAKDLWHTSFHCWIVRRSPEGQPQVLLQIRGKTPESPFPD